MEELEQKFINFYEKYLAKEAEEICKEVKQLNKDEKNLLLIKLMNMLIIVIIL